MLLAFYVGGCNGRHTGHGHDIITLMSDIALSYLTARLQSMGQHTEFN